MERGKFNTDLPSKIAEFEALVNKIFPKKMFYRTLLRGKGLEFDTYRSFGSDEDASLLDWKASIRSNSLLARQYIEERNLNVVFIVDVGENMIFGSGDKLKCEYCTELVAALSHVIVSGGDNVGFILFNDNLVKISPPVASKKQFDILVYNLLDPYLYVGVSDLGSILDRVMETLDPSVSMVILVSDFLRVNDEQKKSFERLGNIFETIALMVRDPLDKTLPDLDKEVIIEDYNGERLLINPSLIKKTYESNVQKQTLLVKEIFQKSNIDLLELDTMGDFVPSLANFLKRRVNRKN